MKLMQVSGEGCVRGVNACKRDAASTAISDFYSLFSDVHLCKNVYWGRGLEV